VTTLLQIAERSVADVTILALTGELVLEEGDTFLRDYIDGLARQGRVKVILDLHDVSHLDSAGIGMIAAKYLTLHRWGGTVKLLHLTEKARYLLRITKLDRVFEIFDSEEAAVRSFTSAPETT
jgi:anti-sigma B factor antagonist